MIDPLVLRAFSHEIEKRALINPVRLNQARKGLLPGRPLLTRFAKTRAGKGYIKAAPAAGEIAHNMHLAAQRGDPAFIMNTGIGGAARRGLAPMLGERAAEVATLAKRQDPGVVGWLAGKVHPAAEALAGVIA
jgi:hypothetical protein